MSFDVKDVDIDIDLIFRLKSSTIPSPTEQCRELWAISRALGRNGLDVAQWGIGDVSDSCGIENSPAFTDLGPTDEAINSVIETPDI